MVLCKDTLSKLAVNLLTLGMWPISHYLKPEQSLPRVFSVNHSTGFLHLDILHSISALSLGTLQFLFTYLRLGGRKNLLPALIRSANACRDQHWARAKARSQEFNLDFPRWVTDTQLLGSSLLPPRICHSRKLEPGAGDRHCI